MHNCERQAQKHEHCFHVYRGVLHMVVPDGHVVLKCCKCSEMKTEHREHANRWVK